MTRVPGRPNKERKTKSHEKSKQHIHSHSHRACVCSLRLASRPRRSLTVAPFTSHLLRAAMRATRLELSPACRRTSFPLLSISFAPVGLIFGQTARLNFVNMDVANCIPLAAASSTRAVLRLPNP